MIDLNLGDDEAEFRCFTSALGTIFRDQPWELVEQHAKRAWMSANFAGGASWGEVVERIRAGWPRAET